MDLRDRTLNFSRDIIRFVKPLQKDVLARPLVAQLIRSGTSIGANFIEAKNGSSRKDFRNKVFISKKEASESLYWLKLLEEFTDSAELKKLQKECQELILILQKIINTLDS
jgi:four helix bundle protein